MPVFRRTWINSVLINISLAKPRPPVNTFNKKIAQGQPGETAGKLTFCGKPAVKWLLLRQESGKRERPRAQKQILP